MRLAVPLRAGYSDVDLWITFVNGVLGWIIFISAVGRDLTYFMLDLIEQWASLGWVIDVLLCQYGSNDQPSVDVHRQVQLSPVTTRLLAVLFSHPFAPTKSFDSPLPKQVQACSGASHAPACWLFCTAMHDPPANRAGVGLGTG